MPRLKSLHRDHLLRLAFFALLLLSAKSALALDPSSAVKDFIRTDFTVENGLPSNVVNAILQTRNGFLWVGTDAGLARFDGRQFTPIPLHGPESALQGNIHALAQTPDGALWVGTETGLARIAQPALVFFDRSQLSIYDPGPGAADEIRALHVSHDGTLWVGTNAGLFRFDAGRFIMMSRAAHVLDIKETTHGHLLVATDLGLWEWDGSHVLNHPEAEAALKVKNGGIFQAYEAKSGETWYCSMHGLSRKIGATWKHLCWNDYATEIYEDPSRTLWVSLASGLYRLRDDRIEKLTNFTPRTIAADKDGDLWVGSNGAGLIRFKDRMVRMFTTAQGLPNNVVMTVLLRKNGSLWVGNNCGGLSRFDGTRFHTYSEKDGLTNSCVWSLAEDPAEHLWIGTWGGGLFELVGSHFLQFGKKDGLPSGIVRGLVAGRDGSLWIAADGGVSHMVDGKIRTYTTADGLSSHHVLSVFEDHQDRIWAATTKGIDRLENDRFVNVITPQPISDPRLTTFGEDSRGDLYALDGPRGIDLLSENRFINLVPDLDLFGMLSSKDRLWFAGGNGLISIEASNFPIRNRRLDLPLNFDRFGLDDGLASEQTSVGSPNMAITEGGTLWLATVKGLARLETDQVHCSSEKLLTFISDVSVGRSKRTAGRELLLPPGTHHVELQFDAISLRSPEKIHFEYRMDDVDSNWLDSGPTFTAVYSAVPIGRHLFHVRASNADGNWDPIGIVYPVFQEPFVYQTTWFRVTAALAALLLLILAYLRRLRHLDLQYKSLVEERVAERTRIARELHDTLLQSFQGLMFRFQAVANLLPEQPGKAKASLDIAIERAASAITEGRSAVEELRRRPETREDLVPRLRRLGNELGEDGSGEPVNFELVVEGGPRALNAHLAEDLFRILGEAVRNAFRHARAKQIEVEFRYDARALRVRVRDDGTGIDPSVLGQGRRERHWGLPGMRERAQDIGARFELWSHLGGGTEIEVYVPAHIAYASGSTETKRQ